MAKILIVGGGVSGLSAGIYAQLHGHRAIICEKHDIPGGNLTGWQREGYHIDNCIHWLTGTNPATKTYGRWEVLGALGRVEVYQGDTLYTCEHEGVRLSLHRDLARTEADMLSLSPGDEKEIRSLIRAVRLMQGLCGIRGAQHDRKNSLPQKVTLCPALLKYYKLTTGQLSERFSHPLLKAFMGSFMGKDFGALALLFVFAHFCGDNGGLPQGGSLAMAQRMAARFQALGGELRLKKEVTRIHCEDGYATGVTFSDGTTEEADYLVLTSDPAAIFPKLLEHPMPRQLLKAYRHPQMSRFSSFQCAFACDLPEAPFRGDFILSPPRGMTPELSMPQVVLREFSHEKSFSPPGKSLIQALIFCNEEEAKSFIRLREQDKSAYDDRKAAISEEIRRLITLRFPQTEDKLTCIDSWTPATYRRYTNAQMGSYMSFILPAKTLPVRMSPRVKGIKNLLLATQWQQAPGGLPIAAEGGRRAVMAINKLEAKAKWHHKERREKQAPTPRLKQT